MTTRTEKFQRKPRDAESEPVEAEEVLRFPPEEEASLLAESNTLKAAANALFAQKSYKEAIDTYESALSTCPKYLEYERAVLKRGDVEEKVKKEEEADEEIISEGAAKSEDTRGKDIDDEKESRAKDIERIRAKALMRRARARSEQDGWSTLAGAIEDYKLLSNLPTSPPSIAKTVETQLRLLPPRSKAAQDREMGEMMGKLKQVSLIDSYNFQMVKDEKTGGYSMNFNQGGNS
ncbi:hypothetical protein DID88_010436 [Monilinia fructigena]|uniref:Uncharacterized protein n=1 Tax=Monilinia fructigena TaxID=38457 RepID=A0A395ILD8_9HELO|nr:hypothetical protein DID88_010436 [Monilinia fructigena]